MSIVARSARVADGNTDAGRPTTSSPQGGRPPRSSCSLARRGRPDGTCRRSTRTGSARPSTGSTRRRSPRASSPRPARTARGAVRGGRRALRPAPRRRARAYVHADARRGRGGAASSRRTWTSCSTAASGSWASATASTARRIRARACCAAPRRSSARHRFEVAEELERVALAELQARKPDRVLATNVEYWSAVVLDVAEIPPRARAGDVRLLARRRLVGAHPRAEAPRSPRPAVGALRRPRAPAALGRLAADASCRSR